jgi:hypothetical protein
MLKVLGGLAVIAAVTVAGGGPADRDTPPSLSASGPVSVTGTEATSVFTVGDRTVRQVRYADRGTLTYTFRVTNPGPAPLDVLGLAEHQDASRLFRVTALSTPGRSRPVHLAAASSAVLRVAMRMSGCETLSSRAGAFLTRVWLRIGTDASEEVLAVPLPEELHTGSPREAFCPNSTATSRPPG